MPADYQTDRIYYAYIVAVPDCHSSDSEVYLALGLFLLWVNSHADVCAVKPLLICEVDEKNIEGFHSRVF